MLCLAAVLVPSSHIGASGGRGSAVQEERVRPRPFRKACTTTRSAVVCKQRGTNKQPVPLAQYSVVAPEDAGSRPHPRSTPAQATPSVKKDVPSTLRDASTDLQTINPTHQMRGSKFGVPFWVLFFRGSYYQGIYMGGGGGGGSPIFVNPPPNLSKTCIHSGSRS